MFYPPEPKNITIMTQEHRLTRSPKSLTHKEVNLYNKLPDEKTNSYYKI